MSLLISESGSEPITTAEAKAWAKVENSDEDSLISSLITSCRREIESYTKNVLRPQIWQTVYQFEYPKTIFYSPRLQATSVTVTVDDEAYTDFTFNEITGRLKINNEYSSSNEIAITWNCEAMLYSLAPLKQALLDLVTYRFYNRGSYDLPAHVVSVLNQYRVFNV